MNMHTGIKVESIERCIVKEDKPSGTEAEQKLLQLKVSWS